ncbi:hypothetical protein WHR41_07276 [Cladosporium halotolerans]|uniref:ATP-dependent RNA helicase n=1 Tax=Cladosporium halotolerans TaxID=1052096 RepID=A0AB34KHF8_9PEZI
MAAEGKRALPPKVAAMKARKRQKTEQPSTAERPAKKAKTGNGRQPVRLDKLPWKDVSMPDRMDDYEGFFGLEEIDDVDVLRDDATGKVSYVTRHEPTAEESDEYESDGEEFTGFGDDEPDVPEPAAVPADEVEVKKNGKEADVPEPASVPADEVKAKKEKKSKAEPKPKEDAKSKAQKSATEKAVAPSAQGAFHGLDAADDDEETDISEWLPLKLSPDTMSALAKLKFAKPSTIQSAAIPEILEGHDVIGKASTGSGKTLAFGIPILERFLEQRSVRQKSERKSPLALILSPTRELAHQLSDHLQALCSNNLFEGPLIATITGGLSVQKQQRQLKDADIVVGTPGRLWEVISDGHGFMDALKELQFLVVDEADRLLSEGHFKEVEEILNVLDRQVTENEDPEPTNNIPQKKKGKNAKDTKNAVQGQRQTLVFSATFDRGLQKKLAGKAQAGGGDLMSNRESMEYLLKKLNFREETPKFVDVNPITQMATGLKEGMIECGGTEKDLYLYTLLLHYRNARTLVFCNSISAVKRITPFLQNLELPALALHSGMIQKARLRSVERFKDTKENKSAPILVATDVAARGLDIPNVQLVVHYHLPRAADMYVHRSGRTARAGQQGSSILICGPEEVNGTRRLIAKVHAKSALGHEDDASVAAKQGYYIRSLDMDRRIVSRLRPRAQLAKKLADMATAKTKKSKEDDFMRAAAEELGVEYDSEEFEKQAPGRQGRGANRKKKEREAADMTKGEAAAMRAELKDLLKQRVNVGVSEKYLTSGRVDIDELLRQQELGQGKTGEFLGSASLGLEDL